MKKSIGAKTMAIPTPVWVIGTYDVNSKPNLMTASWAGICCSRPPCIQVSMRKETYSHANIVRRKAFTINVPSENFAKEVDYIGMVSGKMQDKFLATQFTPVKSSTVEAPYIEEFPLNIECKLVHTFELGLHTMFVGEIMDVKIDENMFTAENLPDVMQIKPLIFSPESHTYHGISDSIGKAFNLGASLIEASANKLSF